MRIRVTAKDIAQGEAGMPSCCPIALAMQRRVKTFVRVFGFWFTIANGNTAMLPSEAQNFVRDFDRGRPVEPFSFEIEI